MTEAKQPEALPPGDTEALLEEVLAWNGTYPVKWDKKFDDVLSDPAVFTAFLAMHAVVWGPSPELAKTQPPKSRNPALKGEDRRN